MGHKVGKEEATHPSKKILLGPGSRHTMEKWDSPAGQDTNMWALPRLVGPCNVRVQGGGRSLYPLWGCLPQALMSPVLGLPEPSPWICPAPQGNSRTAGLG